MKLSKKINNILPSSTVILGQKARELISLGKDIIQLGEGEPDFNTPDHIIDAALDAMHKGETKYTNVAGTQKLRKVIKKYLQFLCLFVSQPFFHQTLIHMKMGEKKILDVL